MFLPDRGRRKPLEQLELVDQLDQVIGLDLDGRDDVRPVLALDLAIAEADTELEHGRMDDLEHIRVDLSQLLGPRISNGDVATGSLDQLEGLTVLVPLLLARPGCDR